MGDFPSTPNLIETSIASKMGLMLSPVGENYRRVAVENLSIVSDIEAFFPAFDTAAIHP